MVSFLKNRINDVWMVMEWRRGWSVEDCIFGGCGLGSRTVVSVLQNLCYSAKKNSVMVATQRFFARDLRRLLGQKQFSLSRSGTTNNLM